jgi:protein-tyrosine phosphatase
MLVRTALWAFVVNIKYSLLFALMGLAQLYLGVQSGYVGGIWFWSGMSFFIVAAGYGGLGAKIFGKRPDGTLRWWNVLLLLPYLLLTWSLWHLQRWLSKEPCHHQVAPNLWIGRRALCRELPNGINLVVDLTAELAVPHGVKEGREYLCVPTLDSSVPERREFERILQAVLECKGGVYIHCANGHGRSATLVLAVLLASTRQETLKQAEAFLKQVRPGIGLHSQQRRLLEILFP